MGYEWGSTVTGFTTASEIDKHVGQRIRGRRETLKLSQGRLGRHLGVTFSQIQKYEKGSNRIGAGRLYQIATFLGVTPDYFFEGLTGAKEEAPRLPRSNVSVDEMRTLTEAYSVIPDQTTRDSVLALVSSLSADYRSKTIAR